MGLSIPVHSTSAVPRTVFSSTLVCPGFCDHNSHSQLLQHILRLRKWHIFLHIPSIWFSTCNATSKLPMFDRRKWVNDDTFYVFANKVSSRRMTYVTFIFFNAINRIGSISLLLSLPLLFLSLSLNPKETWSKLNPNGTFYRADAQGGYGTKHFGDSLWATFTTVPVQHKFMSKISKTQKKMHFSHLFFF